MIERTRILRMKPKLNPRWHRGPCMEATCRRAGTAGLCASHREDVHWDVARDLAAAGLDDVAVMASGGPLRVAQDGYLTLGGVGVHRIVMAALIGRDLYPGENVHHKNGVRFDNHPDNLELWVTSQPAGQRPEDLVAWARVILERYEGLIL